MTGTNRSRRFVLPKLGTAGCTIPVLAFVAYLGFGSRAEAGWQSAVCRLLAVAGPGANQIMIFQDPQFGGNCQVLDVNDYPQPANFKLPDNSIDSVMVGSNVRAVLFKDGNYTGEQSLYEGPGNYPNMGRGEANQVSSIRVTTNGGSRATWHYIGENPSNYDGKWYNNVQGLAHSDGFWYINQETQIWQYDIGADLTSQEIRMVGMPWQLSQHGCNHFGDPDFRNNFLFVPVEGCFKGRGEGGGAYLAVFDSDLNFVCYDQLYKQANNASFFAINPTTEVGYSAGVRLDAANPVHAYRIDWNSIFPDDNTHRFLYDSDADMKLFRQDLTNVDLANPQGAVFSDDGKLFYMTNGMAACGNGGDDNGGLRVFSVSGRSGDLIAKGGNGYGTFEYENHCGWSNWEEPEGMDYVNMDIRPGPYWGQLHVLLLQNSPGDKAHLKHYSMW